MLDGLDAVGPVLVQALVVVVLFFLYHVLQLLEVQLIGHEHILEELNVHQFAVVIAEVVLLVELDLVDLQLGDESLDGCSFEAVLGRLERLLLDTYQLIDILERQVV